MRKLVQEMLPFLRKGAIVTDVGSVKGSVVRDLETMIARRGAHFVGSHPMAGSEKTGVGAARANLFRNAVCVITPTKNTTVAARRKVEALWKSLGARVLRMTPELHDELISRSSHLPHVVAATLAHSVLAPSRRKEQRQLCANGFRDTTRIASGSPEMWRDIALANRKNLARAIKSFIKQLEIFERRLRAGDQAAIAALFSEARQRRERWKAAQISSSPE
jgi:prephenate dehydrogenase